MNATSANAAQRPASSPATNIVLVHGAFADGSGWRGVHDELTARGYRVSIVQNPLTSFEDDVAATRRVLARQDGPAILVGHSYGGSVITEAGTAANVAGLVRASSTSRLSRPRSGSRRSISMPRCRRRRTSSPT